MRDRFPEYYLPGPEDEKRFVSDSTVVVDANVLLDLYELSAAERDEVLDVLANIGPRLWIPYQVGYEYQKNRMKVIRRQAGHYEQLIRMHGAESTEELERRLGKLTLPEEVVDEVRGLLGDLADSLAEATQAYIEAGEKIRDLHVITPDEALRSDPVRNRLDELFDGRVGARPDASTHDKRVKEAARRAEAKVPPGFKDEAKDTPEQRAGDYLLWAELLDKAEATADDGRPFLLVTNDTKDDWYARSDGKVVGPLPELVREFLGRNPEGYHQVTLDRLLELAREHLAAEVEDTTIERASELSQRHAIETLRDLNDAVGAAMDARTQEVLRNAIDNSRAQSPWHPRLELQSQKALRSMLDNPAFDDAIRDALRSRFDYTQGARLALREMLRRQDETASQDQPDGTVYEADESSTDDSN